jgi:hypothetical protein
LLRHAGEHLISLREPHKKPAYPDGNGVIQADFDTPGEACRFNDLGLSSCA